MRKLIIVLSLLFGISAFSQKNIPAFGKPDPAELEMKFYAPDPTADAVKLLDYQEAEMTADYLVKVTTKRRVKIKIFTRKGFDEAMINIFYLQRKKTRITDITGYIYYLDDNGKIQSEKIEKQAIFKDRKSDYLKKIQFAFPNVKPGCVIEYRFVKKEKNTVALSPWLFQDKIPTQLAIYEITAPRIVAINKHVVTTRPVDESVKKIKDYGFTTTYQVKDVPAFHAEPFMSSKKDYLERVEFNFIPHFMTYSLQYLGWRQFGKAFEKAITPIMEKSLPGSDVLVDSAKTLQTNSLKIDYLFKRVREIMNWDQNQSFFPTEFDDAWKDRTGSSADINLVLLNLLRRSGIKAYPLLVSTRENGKTDEKYFNISQFNGLDILCLDDSDAFVMDGVQKYTSLRVPPMNILNRNAYVIDSLGGKWLRIVDTRPLIRKRYFITGRLSEDGTYSGRASVSYFDYAKYLKLELDHAGSQDENDDHEEQPDHDDKSAQIFENALATIKIDTTILMNKDSVNLPLISDLSFNYKLSNTAEFFFLDPLFLAGFTKNPFHDSLRRSEIDFGANESINISLFLELPENFRIEELPKNSIVRMADSSIQFKTGYQKTGSSFIFDAEFTLSRAIFEHDEYLSVKEFFDKIAVIANRPVALIRKP